MLIALWSPCISSSLQLWQLWRLVSKGLDGIKDLSKSCEALRIISACQVGFSCGCVCVLLGDLLLVLLKGFMGRFNPGALIFKEVNGKKTL